MTDEELPTEVRAALARGDTVWDTRTLQEDFSVESFLAPYVIVTRREDGVRGTLQFTHRPRWYFDFQESTR